MDIVFKYKKFLIGFIFVINFLFGYKVEAEAYTGISDSLYKSMEALKSEERLDAYYSFILAHLSDIPPEEMVKISELYLKEAEKQNSLDDEAYAMTSILSYLLDSQQFEKMLDLYPDYLAFFKENNFMSRYYDARLVRNNYYLMSGKYQTAIRDANDFYNELRQNQDDMGQAYALYMLAFAYHVIGGNKCEDYYLESIELFDKQKLDAFVFNVYLNYSDYLYSNAEYDKMLTLCEKWNKDLQKYIEPLDDSFKNHVDAHKYNYNCAMAKALIGSRDFDNAKYYIYLIDNKQNKSLYDEIIISKIKAFYHETEGDVKEAVAQYFKALSMEKTIPSNESNINHTKIKLARLLRETGDYAKAFDYFNEAYIVLDSLEKQDSDLQLDELNSLYQIDKITAKNEKLQYLFLSATIMIFLLIIILIIYVTYSKRIRKKNQVIYNSIVENMKSDLKEVKEEKPEVEKDKNSVYKDLFDKINMMVEKEQFYTDPDITRKTLADHVGSNEKYVSWAIHEAVNCSFTEYINNIRLKHSCILMINDPDISLENLAISCGFKSRSNFYSQFKNKYGVTPGDFRKMETERK